jgi:translation initiation factor 1
MKAKHTFRGVVLSQPPRPFRAPVAVAPASAASKSPPKVRVGREVAGRGGKGVTVITGLPLSAADLDALATKLKKTCGAGGAVNGTVIEIQGDHRDRLVAELQKLGHDAKRSGG